MNCEDEEIVDMVLCFITLLLLYYKINNFEVNRSVRRWWVRPINANRNKEGAFIKLFQFMKSNDHEMFFKYTRMSPEKFNQILNLIKKSILKRSRREFLTPELRLAMTLKYLAHGGSFQNLAWEFRVGHSTISKVILETCEAIWKGLQPIYLKTPTEKGWLKISDNFWNIWNFPHTLGAIDGKHVQIQCPMNSGSNYYNYKSHFSIILMACCDAEYKFIWVDIGAYGSEHDSGVFRRSMMGQNLENGTIKLPNVKHLPGSNVDMPYFFVGDEAFPLKKYIMRPYPGRNLNENKLIFNYRLSRARRVIENSFGILASRWRVYRSPLLCSVKTTESIVKATLCLHNFLRTEASQTYTPRALIDADGENGEMVDGEWRKITRNDKNLTSVGRMGANTAANVILKMRDNLKEYLVSEAGAVPWQSAIVNKGKI